MIYNGFINDSSEIKDTVKAVLDSIESKVHLESQTKYNVELVLRELLNNGIIYSHSRIKFMIKMCGCGIKAAVIDSGNGFDYSKYIKKDITSDDMLLSEGGRGIFISSYICEKFTYNRKGNIVAIRMNLV